MSDFFAMGGYAGFVWPVYGLAALIMVVLMWRTVSVLKRRQAEFNDLDQARHAQRESRREGTTP
ncbi:MAG: heme exporter protein CcmD [Rhodospirillales bacterium]|nr:heme exporter protein CcmD [Rhodospirillales bacterium]